MSPPRRRRDAALAVAFGAVVAVFVPPAPSPVAAAVGVAATLVAEAVLSLRADAVRRAWGRRRVRAATVVVGLVAVGVATVRIGAAASTAVLAGVVTYLLVLARATLRAGGTN